MLHCRQGSPGSGSVTFCYLYYNMLIPLTLPLHPVQYIWCTSQLITTTTSLTNPRNLSPRTGCSEHCRNCERRSMRGTGNHRSYPSIQNHLCKPGNNNIKARHSPLALHVTAHSLSTHIHQQAAIKSHTLPLTSHVFLLSHSSRCSTSESPVLHPTWPNVSSSLTP